MSINNPVDPFKGRAMKKSFVYVCGLVLLFSTSLYAATGSQQVLAPQKISVPASGTVSKSYSFQSPSNIGKLKLQVADGSKITIEQCSGTIVQKLVCSLQNTLKQVLISLTRPSSVEIKVNGVTVISKSSYDPAQGTYNFNVSLSSQNQLSATVKGIVGTSATIEIGAEVSANPPVPVMAVFPTQGFAPLAISASAAGTTDPDSQPSQLSYFWDFGDGGSAIGIMANHVYTQAGNFTVTLKVQDNVGAFATKTQVVQVVQNQAPTARLVLASAGTGIAPLMVMFDASTSSDPDGQPLTYKFNFGDGTEFIGGPTTTHEYKNAGNYTATVAVFDSYQLFSTAQVTVATSDPVLPPDPATVAPPLAQNSLEQPFSSQVEFLYDGPNAIQKNVDVAQMDPCNV